MSDQLAWRDMHELPNHLQRYTYVVTADGTIHTHRPSKTIPGTPLGPRDRHLAPTSQAISGISGHAHARACEGER